jgi:hypothetical protein
MISESILWYYNKTIMTISQYCKLPDVLPSISKLRTTISKLYSISWSKSSMYNTTSKSKFETSILRWQKSRWPAWARAWVTVTAGLRVSVTLPECNWPGPAKPLTLSLSWHSGGGSQVSHAPGWPHGPASGLPVHPASEYCEWFGISDCQSRSEPGE